MLPCFSKFSEADAKNLVFQAWHLFWFYDLCEHKKNIIIRVDFSDQRY